MRGSLWEKSGDRLQRLPARADEPDVRRAGTAYILVLSIAMLVTVLGMGAITLTRVTAVSTAAGVDWDEAGTLAMAAVEQATSSVNADAFAGPSTWRSNYASGAIVRTTALGRGTISWALKDETDGILSEDYLRPVRVYGIARVGKATRVYSVQLQPGGTPLDVLRCALHASGAVTPTANVNMSNGPLSSNSSVKLSGTINGAIEAAGTTGTAAGTNTVTITPAKTMPLANVVADLTAVSTAINYSGLSGGAIEKCVLSAASNPYGAVNPNGVYSVSMPSNKTLKIQNCRIVGTLVIAAGNKGQVQITGPVEWEPGPTNLPILVVQGTKLTVTFTGSPTWLSENSVGVNLNPAGTPYQGVSNTTTSDDYPPYYNGVIHVLGDSSSEVDLNANTYVNGTVIADCPVKTTAQATLIQSPSIYANPPFGYATGNAMTIVGGTWRWDTLP